VPEERSVISLDRLADAGQHLLKRAEGCGRTFDFRFVGQMENTAGQQRMSGLLKLIAGA
jgi:hypothetical protein